ncbi:MAG: flagellar brake protein [Methylococcaceae bacterium]
MTIFKDINLQVGTRLQMSLSHGAIYYTELIGYVEGEYLIIKTPFENGISVQMPVDEPLSLRVLSGTDVFTLICQVQTVFRAPYYYLHLSYPTDIKAITLRGAIRAKVNLAVKINDMIGIIADISVTGASIITDSALGQPDDEAEVTFEFPVKLNNQSANIATRVTIRSTQQLPSKKADALPRFSHGVLFHELDQISQLMILNLVYEAMNRS